MCQKKTSLKLSALISLQPGLSCCCYTGHELLWGRKDVGCCVNGIFRNIKPMLWRFVDNKSIAGSRWGIPNRGQIVCWQESLATSWVKEQPAERDHVIWKLEKYIVRICTYNVIHFISPIVALLQSYLVGRHLVSWMHLSKPGCRISWSKIHFY